MPNVPVSRRIKHIYETYYKVRAREKYIHTMRWINRYSERDAALSGRFTCHIDRIKLGRCMESYYLDVIKYKEYHFNPESETNRSVWSKEFMDEIHGGDRLVNSSKVAAFTTKWLLKARPIYVSYDDGFVPSPREREVIENINETFVLGHSLDLMNCAPSQFDDDIIRELFYHLKYRMADDRCLMLIYKLAEANAR